MEEKLHLFRNSWPPTGSPLCTHAHHYHHLPAIDRPLHLLPKSSLPALGPP